MDDLIEALLILRKYGAPSYPFHCEHDTLYVMIDPEPVSAADRWRQRWREAVAVKLNRETLERALPPRYTDEYPHALRAIQGFLGLSDEEWAAAMTEMEDAP